jgi:hypothetical protein
MTASVASAQAHIGAADVKAEPAAVRSRNKVREAMGMPLPAVDKSTQ